MRYDSMNRGLMMNEVKYNMENFLRDALNGNADNIDFDGDEAGRLKTFYALLLLTNQLPRGEEERRLAANMFMAAAASQAAGQSLTMDMLIGNGVFTERGIFSKLQESVGEVWAAVTGGKSEYDFDTTPELSNDAFINQYERFAMLVDGKTALPESDAAVSNAIYRGLASGAAVAAARWVFGAGVVATVAGVIVNWATGSDAADKDQKPGAPPSNVVAPIPVTSNPPATSASPTTSGNATNTGRTRDYAKNFIDGLVNRKGETK